MGKVLDEEKYLRWEDLVRGGGGGGGIGEKCFNASFWARFQLLCSKNFARNDAPETKCWTKYFSNSHNSHLFLQH